MARRSREGYTPNRLYEECLDKREKYGAKNGAWLAGADRPAPIEPCIALTYKLQNLGYTRDRIGEHLHTLLEKLESLPASRTGDPWTKSNCITFLRFDDRAKTPERLEPLRNVLADLLADAMVEKRFKSDDRTESNPTSVIQSIRHSIGRFLENPPANPGRLLQELDRIADGIAPDDRWARAPWWPLLSIIDNEFLKPAQLPLAKPHRKLVDDLMHRLQNQESRKPIVLYGDRSSGKKPVVAELIRRLRGGIGVKDGALKPILAIDCRAAGASRLIDVVFAWFFLRLDKLDEPQMIDLGGLDQAEKLQLIAEAVITTPVVIVLTDLDATGRAPVHQIVRGASVWPLLDRLVADGSRVQLVVTWNRAPDVRTKLTGPLSRADMIRVRRPRLGNYKELFHPDLHPFVVDWITERADRKLETDGVLVVVAHLLLTLVQGDLKAHLDVGALKAAVKTGLGKPWTESLPEMIRLLWKLLLPAERNALGLLAASADGLRHSTFCALYPQFVADVPSPLDGWARETLGRRLVPIVETAAGRLDARTALPGEAKPETTYEIEDTIRRTILRVWFEESASLMRRAFWLIAREAFAQVRYTRLKAPVSDLASLTREILVFQALVASVDPDAVGSAQEEPYRGPTPEALILPPISLEGRESPPATVALRFAWCELYSRDIEGGFRRRLPMELDEPLAQLDLVLRLFAPASPWHQTGDLRLPDKLPEHLLGAFSAAEVADMLTAVAMAAVRVRRIELVGAAARLAVELELRLPARRLLRLWRTEVDVASMHGGWPLEDQPIVRLPARKSLGVLLGDTEASRILASADLARGMSREHARVDHFLWPACRIGERLARGVDMDSWTKAKLLARAADVMRLLGEPGTARRLFECAEEIDAADRVGTPLFTGGRDVLAGLDLDRWARLLIDEAAGSFSPSRDPLSPFYVAEGDPVLQYAMRLIERNLRSLTARRSRDERLLQLVTQARLAEVRGQFERAVRLLEEIAKGLPNAGASISAHLDHATVGARVAVRAMIGQHPPVGRGWKERAEHNITRLRELAGPVEDSGDAGLSFEPHLCYANLLEARVNLLDAAGTSSRESRFALLESAATKIRAAKGTIHTRGYWMRRAELRAAKEEFLRVGGAQTDIGL